MEAIQPGSSTMVRSPKVDEAFTKDDTHSYESFEVPETAREYDEPILMSPTTTSGASSSTQSLPQTLPPNKEDSDGDDDGRVYSNIPDELYQEDLYTEIDQTDLPAPSEGATTPEEVDEDNLDPNEMQLWLLLQIQKMVQKMEDVYGTSSPKLARRKASNSPMCTKHVHGKAKPPPTTSSPDPPSQAVIQKEINNEDMESRPARRDLYESLDTINEAITESLPPPIPPKTYQVIDGGSKIVYVSEPPGPTRGRRSDQWSQTNTLPSRATQSSARPKPPPLQPKGIQVRQHQIELRAGNGII